VDAVALDRIGEGPDDVLLADHLGKALGPVAAVKRRLGWHLAECIGAQGGPNRSSGSLA